AAPIQWAIARGEAETGVSIMQMDEGMDTGPVLLERRLPIEMADTAQSLSEKLSRLGAEALALALPGILDGTLRPVPQDEALATYGPLLKKEHGQVDFAWSAPRIRDWIRAMDPWPGAQTTWSGQPLRLFQPRVVSGGGEPGRVMGADRDGLLIACGDGAIG